MSIRPGWFYHSHEDESVRSLENLVNIYYQSVGCNSVLLLNIPPDRRGLIHETDVQRIKELNEYLTQTFADNLALDAGYWKAEEGESRELKVQAGATVNTVMLQEDIAKGQRVENFRIETYSNGEWHQVAEGTTIGYKRLLRIPDCQPEKIRLTILASRGDANVSNVGLYFAPAL